MKPLLFLFILVMSMNDLKTTIRSEKSTYSISDTIMITFEISNAGASKNLCKWQSPLEERFTSNMFEVTFEGKVIPYNGIMVKRAAPDKQKDYVKLGKGEKQTALISLSEAYDFSKKGSYTIQFKGSSINNFPDSNTIELRIG